MPNAYNELFASKPLELFRRYAVVPPGKLGGQTVRDEQLLWTDTGGVVTQGARGTSAQVQWQSVPQAEGIVRVNFEPSCGNEKGALTFKLATEGDGVPIYFLPWDSLRVVSLSIPDTGGAFYDPDDPDHPGLFFTAAINGCSVFVKGPPTHPQVFHAGIDGSFASGTDAAAFWQQRLKEILAKQGPGGGHMGAVREVNKADYIKDPRHRDPTTTATADAYERWLTENQNKEFRLQAVSPWGCVFGIRYGRSWTFYLQENATVTTLRYVKKGDTHKVRVNASRTDRKMKGSGETVRKEQVKQKLVGPISYNRAIYMKSEVVSRPMQIREFYPNGGSAIRIKDEVKRV